MSIIFKTHTIFGNQKGIQRRTCVSKNMCVFFGERTNIPRLLRLVLGGRRGS